MKFVYSRPGLILEHDFDIRFRNNYRCYKHVDYKIFYSYQLRDK